MRFSKLIAALALLLPALTGRSQCSTCPTLQGLPDTLPVCKQATIALPVPTITGVQPGTVFYDTLWTATPASAVALSNPFGSNPQSLSTNATVQFQPVKVKLRVRTLGADAAVNGAFTSGNTGFTSAHTYNASSVSTTGTYSIATSPALVNATYASFGDHTTGTGNMMVVNGSTTANTAVWCQTFAADACADYQIGYWAASATSVSPAALRLRINGTLAPASTQLNLTAIPGAWLSSTYFYSSVTSGPVEVCIMNATTAGSGNDFALDDVVIRRMCRLEDSSYLPISNLRPLVRDSLALGCGSDTVYFKADTQVLAGIPATWPDAWQWSFGDGTTSTQANPVHVYAQQGLYNVVLRVSKTKTYNGQSVTCVDSALAQVDTRHLVDAAFQLNTDTLCLGMDVTATDSSTVPAGGTLTFYWGDGTSMVQTSGTKTYKHLYNNPGTYQVSLVARDNVLGCADTARKFFTVLSPSFLANISGPSTICVGQSAALSNATPGGTWSVLTGGTFSISGTGVITGTAVGSDFALYTVKAGLCNIQIGKSINVIAAPQPAISAGNGDTLTTGTFALYSWSRNGTPVAGATGRTLVATQSGSYTVTVTNAAGCSATSAPFSYTPLGGLDAAGARGIGIYPNPASTVVSVRSLQAIGSVLVSTADGRPVLVRRGTGDLDLTALPGGLYTVAVYDPAGQLLTRQKLLKLP